MAKLRTNHGSTRGASPGTGRRRSRGSGLRQVYGVVALLVFGAFALWPRLRAHLADATPAAEAPAAEAPAPAHATSETGEWGDARLFLPVGPSDQVVHHRGFSLGYDNGHEQARWVAYRLSAAEVRAPRLERPDDFRPDPAIRDRSATDADYRGSGLTRGHLAPAADLDYDAATLAETFMLSNIAPQAAGFNGGVWRELEESVRDWAVRHGELYITTGPVFGMAPPRRIGTNAVSVPEAFYKVLLAPSGEAIGFLIPHETQVQPLSAFAKTVDEVEAATGLDFYPELASQATPAREATFELTEWPLDEARFRRRVREWNRRD